MDHFPFALRTNWPRHTNALNQALEDLKSRHVPVADLTASNPTECGFQYPPQMLAALQAAENLRYQPDARGGPRAREAVAHYYARQVPRLSVDEIILTASTSEAYSFLMRLLVNPAEKVLVPKPSYPLFQFLLEINDVRFEQYPLDYDGQWRLDRPALEHLVDRQTRAIILVNPNNPTGSYISREDLDFLNAFCAKHHLSIISDEVFFDFPLNSDGRTTCAGNSGALTFTLGGLSKTFGLPQMKCAWIVASGPQELLQESLARLEIIADTYLSVNTPVQNALSIWLEQAPAFQGQVISRVQDNRQWLSDRLHGQATSLLSLQGGWYATLRVAAVKTEEEWALEFLKEDHVLVYPGYFFDFDKGVHIVLSLLPEPGIFQAAMERVLKRLCYISI